MSLPENYAEFDGPRGTHYRLWAKRFFDIVGAIALMPPVALAIPIVAAAIKFDDRGPTFYVSPRLGKNLIPFGMYKFRTMKVDASDIRNPDGTTFNSLTDPRVTKVGNFLRSTSIDELPQILNVLKGDMSFVGPRPSPLGIEDKYSAKHKEKFNVLPGITGLSQSLRRNNGTLEDVQEDDLSYVRDFSFAGDLRIVLRTAQMVLRREGINRQAGSDSSSKK